MPESEQIYSLDLMYNGTPMPFVIKTMEEIDKALGGIADNPHTHNYYTVIWPVNATGKHIIDFKEYPILPNHIFFVSPGQVHQIISNRKPMGYVILFSPEFLEKNSIRNEFIADLKLFQKSDETPPLPISDKMASTLRLFAEQMLTAFHSHNDMFLETIGAYLKLFLIECNGHCSLSPGTNLQNIEVSKVLVKNFKALVEKNFTKKHQVKYYAESLNITPNYLNEVIKTAMNIPAKDFLQNRLILEAKRMVVFTGKSAKEIGFDLGFEDPSHFSKFFKSNTGQSLQDFKLSLKL
jgi:AraC family transcriptional activator of pobA